MSPMKQRQRQELCLFEEYMAEDFNPKKSGIIDNVKDVSYGIGGVDLSTRWMELVNDGHVAAVTELKTEEQQDGLKVRYGVRLETEGQDNQQRQLMEFVEILPDQKPESCPEMYKHVTSINETLKEMQQRSNGMAMDAVYDGPYAIQLQLVRTLRPKRSKDMSNTNKSNSADSPVSASCQPPPYDASKDSFLVGPLRLFGHGKFHGDGEPRDRAARISIPDTSTHWDIFHNISPVDPRGHFLLLPDIGNEKQWRDQSLNVNDCHHLTYLASTIKPHGSMVISFNSVGAGASQNHIHAHAWLNPPPPLQYRNDPTADYDSVYAVTKAPLISTINLENDVTVSLLKYPCTCVKISATLPDVNKENNMQSTLKKAGDALYKIITVAQKFQAPHNVVWINNAAPTQTKTDIYIFFRSAESIHLNNTETFRLGSSEMLGVFHATSKEQMTTVKKYRGLSCYGAANVLSDVSYEPRGHVWAEVSNVLVGEKKVSRRLVALKKAELYKKEKSDDT